MAVTDPELRTQPTADLVRRLIDNVQALLDKQKELVKQELQEELQFHLEEEARERQAQGLAAEDALRVAQRDLGNLALVKEDTRATWTWTFVEQFVQDVDDEALTLVEAQRHRVALAIQHPDDQVSDFWLGVFPLDLGEPFEIQPVQ